MEISQFLVIGCAVLAGLVVVMMIGLFFVSRKSQKVMQSLLDIMLQPERIKITEATRVLGVLLADEIGKIEQSFQTMRDTLNAQINYANELKESLTTQNEHLVGLADDATARVDGMAQRLDDTVAKLGDIVQSESWQNTKSTTETFSSTVNTLLEKVDTTCQDVTERTGQIQTQIDSWIESEKTLAENLQNEFNSNADQMKNIVSESDVMKNKLSELSQSVTDGFNNVKNTSADYENIMKQNDKLLGTHLDKMEAYSVQSKKLLTSRMNTLTNTANVVASQVRLVESSIDKQIAKLTAAVEALMNSATNTEESVRGISSELAGLTNRFDGEIKEFATGVVS
jgi:HAMP domain-containing protein